MQAPGRRVVTTQLYFPESVTDAVYSLAPYAARGPRSTTNATDGVGAPEPLIRGVENGDPTLHWVTAGIALLLAIWSAYAFAGAGLIRRLPLMRTALVAISAIYLARGLLILPVLVQPEPRPFDLWSSLIVLGYGVVYAVGTARAWRELSQKEALA